MRDDDPERSSEHDALRPLELAVGLGNGIEDGSLQFWPGVLLHAGHWPKLERESGGICGTARPGKIHGLVARQEGDVTEAGSPEDSPYPIGIRQGEHAGLVRLGPPLEGASDIPPAIVNVPGDTRAGDWVVRIRTDPLDGDANSPVAAVDATAVQGVLKLRSLATGDRIELRGVTRKVSDLLVNEKVPAWQRPGIVVLADSAGVVALFGGRGTFVRDGAEPDLWVKLSAIAPR